MNLDSQNEIFACIIRQSHQFLFKFGDNILERDKLKARMEPEMEAYKNLNRKKDKLVQEIKKLNKDFEQNKISREDYEKNKHKLERELVEVMDYLVQYKYVLNLK